MPVSSRKFETSRVNDTTVIRLAGPAITDEIYIVELDQDLSAVLNEAQPPDLLLDFSDITFLSSSMLGILTTLLKRVRKKDGRLRLCSIHPSILEVFKITKLDTIFEIYPDAQKALR